MPHKSPGVNVKQLIYSSSLRRLNHDDMHWQHPYNDIINPRLWEANHRSIASQHKHFASSFNKKKTDICGRDKICSDFIKTKSAPNAGCRYPLLSIHLGNVSIKLPRGLWPYNIVTCIFILSPHQNNKFQVSRKIYQRECAAFSQRHMVARSWSLEQQD